MAALVAYVHYEQTAEAKVVEKFHADQLITCNADMDWLFKLLRDSSHFPAARILISVK